MKKIISIIALFMIAITNTKAQGSLVGTIHTDLICQKQATDITWGAWGATNATFKFYKNGSVATNIEAYFDVKDNFQGVTNFIVYAENKVQEENGYSYYLYVYSSKDFGTSKTYDRSEYFKIKDQIKENMSSIQLIGYENSTEWAWRIYSYIKN